jgi:hypothetical protein
MTGFGELLDPTANFTGPFRFFDLPRELRDIVYHHAWAPTRLKREPKDLYGASQLTVTASYGYGTDTSPEDRCNTSLSVPAWLTANKAFHREAMLQFFSNYSLEMELPGSDATNVFHFGSERRNHTALTWNDISQGFTGYTHISPQFFAHNSIELMTAWPIKLKLVQKMSHGLRSGHWGEEKSKTLVIAFATYLERLNRKPIVDLSGFESLGFKLDVLRVEATVDNDDDVSRRGTARLLPIMEEEITRLGQVLVGKGASLKVAYGSVLGSRNASHWRFEVSSSESWARSRGKQFPTRGMTT